MLEEVNETIQCKFIRKYFSKKRSDSDEYGRGMNRAGEGIVRAGYRNKKGQKNNKMDF